MTRAAARITGRPLSSYRETSGQQKNPGVSVTVVPRAALPFGS